MDSYVVWAWCSFFKDMNTGAIYHKNIGDDFVLTNHFTNYGPKCEMCGVRVQQAYINNISVYVTHITIKEWI